MLAEAYQKHITTLIAVKGESKADYVGEFDANNLNRRQQIKAVHQPLYSPNYSVTQPLCNTTVTV